MEKAVEWLSCMKCVGGHAQADNESPQESTRNSHKCWVFMLEGTRCTNKQTSKEKEREGEESQQPAVLLTGLLCPPSNKLGPRWAAQFARHSGSFRGHRMK